MPVCQSEWPLGLRRRSEVSLLLRLSARIPPGAWMSVSCECCVLSGRGLCDELITFPEESCQLWCVGVESSRMRRQWSSGTGRESNANIAQTMHRTKCHCRDLEHAVSRSDPECSGMFHLTVALPFSSDRSVGIVSKQDNQVSMFNSQKVRKIIFFFRNVKASSGGHSSSYSAGAGGPLLGVNMAGTYLSTASI